MEANGEQKSDSGLENERLVGTIGIVSISDDILEKVRSEYGLLNERDVCRLVIIGCDVIFLVTGSRRQTSDSGEE